MYWLSVCKRYCYVQIDLHISNTQKRRNFTYSIHAKTKSESTQAHITFYIAHMQLWAGVACPVFDIHIEWKKERRKESAKNEIMTRTMRNYRHIARHDTTQTHSHTYTQLSLPRIQKYAYIVYAHIEKCSKFKGIQYPYIHVHIPNRPWNCVL